MVRLLVAFFFLFSFGLAPAMDGCCSDADNAQIAASAAHDHGSSDHSDGKGKVAHHCGICHVHASDRMLSTAVKTATATGKALIPVSYHHLPAAFKPGPLLEPPSHA